MGIDWKGAFTMDYKEFSQTVKAISNELKNKPRGELITVRKDIVQAILKFIDKPIENQDYIHELETTIMELRTELYTNSSIRDHHATQKTRLRKSNNELKNQLAAMQYQLKNTQRELRHAQEMTKETVAD